MRTRMPRSRRHLPRITWKEPDGQAQLFENERSTRHGLGHRTHAGLLAPLPLMAADGGNDDNPNLADGRLGATPTASSVSSATPFSYRPTRVFGPNLNANWETDGETRGAWLQV